MQLSDEELRDVLSRAEEIQRTSRQGPEWAAEVAAVIGAAEGVGLSRQAVTGRIRDLRRHSDDARLERVRGYPVRQP